MERHDAAPTAHASRLKHGRGNAIATLLRRMVRRVGEMDSLDAVAVRIGAAGHRVLRDQSAKNLATGTWLGHPLHPVLSDLPIGCWFCAVALDAGGGSAGRDSADALAALGVVSALPAVLTGLADWSDTSDQNRRIGLVHAAANVLGTTLFAASLLPGRRGSRRVRTTLRVAGLGVVTAGGYLGGHLTFGQGVGVDQNALGEAPTYWARVARASELKDGRLIHGAVDRYDVLVYMRDGEMYALADRCSHASGPLHEGQVDAEGCVVCPWHGSRFRVTDGSVVRGPASAPQPAFDVRVIDDDVEVRLKTH